MTLSDQAMLDAELRIKAARASCANGGSPMPLDEVRALIEAFDTALAACNAVRDHAIRIARAAVDVAHELEDAENNALLVARSYTLGNRRN